MLIERVGEPAALELLAEECVELAHAALKLARAERKENPTPTTVAACEAKVIEEMADVRICLSEIMAGAEWFDSEDLVDAETEKWNRMKKRLK